MSTPYEREPGPASSGRDRRRLALDAALDVGDRILAAAEAIAAAADDAPDAFDRVAAQRMLPLAHALETLAADAQHVTVPLVCRSPAKRVADPLSHLLAAAHRVAARTDLLARDWARPEVVSGEELRSRMAAVRTAHEALRESCSRRMAVGRPAAVGRGWTGRRADALEFDALLEENRRIATLPRREPAPAAVRRTG